MDEYVNFLLNDVRIRPEDVEKLQIHPLAPYCFVGLPSKEKMDEVWERIKDGIVWSGKGLVAPFLCEDRYTEVKIKGCNYQTDELELGAQMGFYGEVLSCKEYRTKIKGIGGQLGGRTGDFLLKMKLQRPIPRLLPIADDGELWVAYYEGQEDVCWKCFLPGHFTRACPNPDQGPRAFTRNQKEARGYAALTEDFSEDEQAEDSARGQDAHDVEPAEADHTGPAQVDAGDQQHGANGPQEQPLNLQMNPAPERSVISDPLLHPSIRVVPGSPSEDDMFVEDSQEERIAVEAADLNSALANEDDMENFGFSPLDEVYRKEKKAAKKERQREKRLLSANSSDALPKRNRSASGSLEQSPIGAQRDERRGSSGNLNPVTRPRMTPAERTANIAQGTTKTATMSRPGSSKEVRLPPLLKN